VIEESDKGKSGVVKEAMFLFFYGVDESFLKNVM